MRLKYQQDLEEDDRRLKQMVMNAAIFGVNKKRSRQEADLESDDEFEKRKQDRIRERINSQEEAEMEQQLMEGGQGRVQEMMRLKQLAQEEELSDNEI